MMNTLFTLDELIAATGATTRLASLPPARVWTDTRSLAPGDVFVPLVGDRFNGHDYVASALDSGAAAAFASEKHRPWAQDTRILWVPDTLLAYMAMGRAHRQRVNPKIVAVTGSSGKTTTKEMLFSALSPFFTAQATEKNFNNDIGVTQTLLSIRPDTTLQIVEMGMRGQGQIARLSVHAQPDIAIVTNIGPAHLEQLGSLQNIALAKCEIFQGLAAGGVGVINGDDELLTATAPWVYAGKLERFSVRREATDIAPDGAGIAFSTRGRRVRLKLPGIHMVANALCVMKVAELLGLDPLAVIPYLEAYEGTEGRYSLTPLPGAANAWVVNDAYNANPSSMRASLEGFLGQPTNGLRRVLVLGGMKELGDASARYHQELWQWLRGQSGIESIILVGEEWPEYAQADHFPVMRVQSAAHVAKILKPQGLDNVLLLLKGSRAYGLDQVIPLLTPVLSTQENSVV
jgi:UDP-N-acetylmuramoyl-tripeptide--D-alanyl-D-alanine ligase